jgi:hypothetical protein
MPKRTSQLSFHFTIFLEERIPSILLLLRRILFGCPFRTIPLTKGLFAIVDPDDYHRLVNFNWHASKSAHTHYAVRYLPQCNVVSLPALSLSKGSNRRKNKIEYMHHLIINIPEGLFCDHINHNGLDNRKANLRPATFAENMRNRRKYKTASGSKYKGVTWQKESKGWRVRITVNNKQILLGQFKDEVEAAKAYDRAAKHYYGDFATLNFPQLKTNN